MTATVFEMYKAQAMVLVPIVRELEKRLGKDEAQRLVHDAIGDTFHDFGRQMNELTKEGREGDFGEQAVATAELFSEGDALEIEIHEKTEKNLKFDVTKCKYAELYKSLNAPELGFLFACNQDYPFQNGMGDELVMNRPQTIMEGYSRCKFNWYVAKDAGEARKKRQEEESIAWERRRKINKA